MPNNPVKTAILRRIAALENRRQKINDELSQLHSMVASINAGGPSSEIVVRATKNTAASMVPVEVQ